MTTRIPLILGTANFCNLYGVTNMNKIPSFLEISELLVTAQVNKINWFDSAPTYGEAEKIIGQYHKNPSQIKLITKISNVSYLNEKEIIFSLEKTIRESKVKNIWALLLHNCEELNGSSQKKVVSVLSKIKKSGLVEKIGVSSYSAQQAIEAKIIFPELEVFQFPENIADRRGFKESKLSEMKLQGDTLLVRSIFLQGLLLLKSNKIPKKFKSLGKLLGDLNRLSNNFNVENIDLCMSYANSLEWASGLVVGAQNANQLQRMVDFKSVIGIDWEKEISSIDEWFLDPRNWS